MNKIIEKENEDPQLEVLFSQRYLYSDAKKYFTIRSSIALGFALLGPLIGSQGNTLSSYFGFFALIYLLLDNFSLEKLENGKKETAAKLQELFDTKVFDLPWNNFIAGPKPDLEIVGKILLENPVRDYSELKLVNWYPERVKEVDLELGRFLCQRENVWWESDLRKKYLYVLIGAALAILVVIFTLAITLDLTIANLILWIIMPLLPLGEMVIKQVKLHEDSSKCVKELKDKLDNLIEDLINKKKIENLESVARICQDEIFRHRKKSPMVYDWIYNLFLSKQEEQMQYSVGRKVDEYLNNKNVL